MAFNNASLVAKDLFLIIPRLARKAGNFAIHSLPDAVEDIRDLVLNGGSMIADATSQRALATNTSIALAEKTAGITYISSETWSQGFWSQGLEDSATMFGKILQGIGKVKNLGGVFSYLTSRWALATFAAAIILNRAQFYASSREHLQLKWYARMAIYLIPMMAFLLQMQTILEALRCQTSPDFSQLRYNDPLKVLSMDFGGEAGFLYKMSSTILWWKDDNACCDAGRMSYDSDPRKGSMSLLFSFFITLCTSQLFETLACALQGKQPVPETGMTLFEHSLAFAECEAMISSALGLGFSRMPGVDTSTISASQSTQLFTRNDIIQRLNVPPEVLLVCLISCFSHLSSATLAVTGLRDKVRLVNTGIWACCYMAAFVWSFFRVFMDPIHNSTDLGVLRFPTVCIVGFIPHVLILVGIVLCGIIYGAALLLTALSVPPDIAAGMSIKQRLRWAYGNLQANVQFSQSSAIRVKMSEDFYTTILKIGFNVLTAASEAVYLNEGVRIHIGQSTWVERKRIDEISTFLGERNKPQIPAELLGEEIARGVELVDHGSVNAHSPYARERRSKPRKSDPNRMHGIEIDSGLGLTQRRSRMQLTFDFLTSFFWLVTGIYARMILAIARRAGIERVPRWLRRLAGSSQSKIATTQRSIAEDESSPVSFLLLDDNGFIVPPQTEDVDVETEMRRMYVHQGNYEGEEDLSDRVYRWWSGGGWFGNADHSGDYMPSTPPDDDATSLISVMTDDANEDMSGQRTPTQDDWTSLSRDATPETDTGLDHLAALLNPATSEAREQARLLSYSLRARRPLTRQQLARTIAEERSRVIWKPASESNADVTEHELEAFLLQQREKSQKATGSGSWASGAEGMGEGGPQCVVCQSMPRTILVWPCGCLCMCDECRVGLAARNFTQCVCCRTDIAAYSRLYVP